MQTSLAPGFYIRDAAGFARWASDLKQMHGRLRDNCIFSVFDTKPKWMRDLDREDDRGVESDGFAVHDFDDQGQGNWKDNENGENRK